MSWNPVSVVAKAVSTVTGAVADSYQKKQETKQAKITANAKLAVLKQEGKNAVTLSDSEWEKISIEKSDSTWKDEYTVLVITSPIPLTIIAAIHFAFTGDPTFRDGVTASIEALRLLLPNYGEVLYWVALAAVGIKGFKGLIK